MSVVLGIDPAWSDNNPSGVALLEQVHEEWFCRAVAPSYTAYIDLSYKKPVNWNIKQYGSQLNHEEILNASNRILKGKYVDIVAIDMPLSKVPITGRRNCDSIVSRTFGGRGCSTHSPNLETDRVSTKVRDGFIRMGYPLITDASMREKKGVIEVYPHPALLTLMKADYRLPYKVQKKGRTKDKLIETHKQIVEALGQYVKNIALHLPAFDGSLTKAFLKRHEDAIDAIISGWVGTMFLEDKAMPYGDEEAAIWIP
jgi:predicted RNase H-like nuclease